MKPNADDLKVMTASVAGVGNWALTIDVWLKIAVSAVTLVYIGLKIVELLRRGHGGIERNGKERGSDQ